MRKSCLAKWLPNYSVQKQRSFLGTSQASGSDLRLFGICLRWADNPTHSSTSWAADFYSVEVQETVSCEFPDEAGDISVVRGEPAARSATDYLQSVVRAQR